jgi:hypothetical protein
VLEADSWARSSSIEVLDNIELLYYPHFVAMLRAEAQIQGGVPLKKVAKQLQGLAGVRGVALVNQHGEGYELPPGGAILKTLRDSILTSSRASLTMTSPMMQRRGGGQIRYFQTADGGQPLTFLVRFIRPQTTSSPVAAIAISLNRDWLLGRIPSLLDSLAHESRQLLFWAASPTNRFMEQSLGITTAEGDTLWWIGRRDVEAFPIQPVWPFEDIKIHSYVRPVLNH